MQDDCEDSRDCELGGAVVTTEGWIAILRGWTSLRGGPMRTHAAQQV